MLPFALFIEPEQNKFSLTVPREFCFDQPKDVHYNRAKHIYFPSLRILPEFFNIRNLALNHEPPVEPKKVNNFSLGLQFKMHKVALPNDTSRPAVIITHNVETVIKDLNKAADILKKNWQYMPPFLVDFVPINDTTNNEPQLTLKPELLSLWYGTNQYNETLHKKTLFTTRNYPHCNPYSLPLLTNINTFDVA